MSDIETCCGTYLAVLNRKFWEANWLTRVACKNTYSLLSCKMCSLGLLSTCKWLGKEQEHGKFITKGPWLWKLYWFFLSESRRVESSVFWFECYEIQMVLCLLSFGHWTPCHSTATSYRDWAVFEGQQSTSNSRGGEFTQPWFCCLWTLWLEITKTNLVWAPVISRYSASCGCAGQEPSTQGMGTSQGPKLSSNGRALRKATLIL